jgi:hypothetical protein
LTHPECAAALLTEIPGDPSLAYAVPPATTDLPTQEPSFAGVRRPTGLAGCDLSVATPAPAGSSPGAPVPSGVGAGQIPATGGPGHFGGLQTGALGAAAAGLWWLRRRREAPPPCE